MRLENSISDFGMMSSRELQARKISESPTGVVLPSIGLVEQAKDKNLSLLETMKFTDKKTDWSFIANSFVFSKKYKR